MLKILFIAIFFFTANVYADQSRPDLTIVQGSDKHIITKNDLRQIHFDSVVVNDPVYNKHKRYAGYWLTDILSLAGIRPDPDTVWTFKALDGFEASIAVADIQKYGYKAFVAVEDLDKEEGWEKFQHGKEWITPAPYYVVWQSPLEDEVPRIKLPWPYQMIEISIHKNDEAQQNLPANDNDANQSVKHGQIVFRQNCMACHSINLEGGTVGPELNVPKNILEYEDRKFLKEFISDPSSFRAASKMPTFNRTLSPKDIDDVLDYLAWMGKHKLKDAP